MLRYRLSAPLLVVALLAACDRHPAEARGGADAGAAEGEARTGYVLDSRGEPVEIGYTAVGNHAFWQGDIYLGPADQVATDPDALRRAPGARFALLDSGRHRLWPGGAVPYRFADDFPSKWRTRFNASVAHIESRVPGLDFRLWTGEADYLLIVPSSLLGRCASQLRGRMGGPQYVSLGHGCLSTGLQFSHELLHAVGLEHEHNRCDRGQYVIVDTFAVRRESRRDFDRWCDQPGVFLVDSMDYDEASIMHYPRDASRRLLATTHVFTSLRGRDHLFGQRDSLSLGDISVLNTMYPATVPVQRWYSYYRRDHFYTLNQGPLSNTTYVLENFAFFYLAARGRGTSDHFLWLYGCYVGGHNFISADPNCDAGVAAQRALGRAARWHIPGTQPLYRTRAPDTGDRLMTWEKWERDMTLSWGWIDEGIVGYVWPKRGI